jgi:uncharacterized membrane protein YeaQ/YmgE (transglycosylase-associated protein family)
MFWTIIGAVIVGAILGYLGKMLLPGRQDIPAWSTVGAGIVAALLGGWLARAFHWGGIGTFILEVILAVIAVAIVANLFGRRGHSNTPTQNY